MLKTVVTFKCFKRVVLTTALMVSIGMMEYGLTEILLEHNSQHHGGTKDCDIIDCHQKHVDPQFLSASGIVTSTGTFDSMS